MARATGGVDRLDLTKIWQAPRAPEFYNLRSIILVALLGIFCLDALAARVGRRWASLPVEVREVMLPGELSRDCSELSKRTR